MARLENENEVELRGGMIQAKREFMEKHPTVNSKQVSKRLISQQDELSLILTATFIGTDLFPGF